MRGLFRWSSKWWPGLIPLVVVWVFAAWSSTARLENDLVQRSNAALKETVLDKTRVTVGGRDTPVWAAGFPGGGRRGAVASVGGVAGARRVNDQTRLVAEAR